MKRWLESLVSTLRRWGPTSKGSALFTGVLVATTVVSLYASASLRGSWAAHQRGTDLAIGEYAAFAARLFVDRAYTVFESIRLRALASVTGARIPDDAPIIPLEEFSLATRDVLTAQQVAMDDSSSGFFLLDPSTGRYEGSGYAADSAVERYLRAEIPRVERQGTDTSSQPVRWLVMLQRGEPVTAGFAVLRDSKGNARAIYGFTFARRRWWKAVGEAVLRDLPLLPPSLTDPSWRYGVDPIGSDSLISLTLIDQRDSMLYQSRDPFLLSISGVFDTRNTEGGLRTVVTLHPNLVARLRERLHAAQRTVVRFHLPVGRPRTALEIPADVLIPFLSLLFALTAALHLRRERALVRARRDFLASVSHELRTPLAQVRMFSETLLLGRERDAREGARWLDVMSRESRRLGDLVENILLFSHLDTDHTKLEKERTDLGELVEEVVEAYVPVAASREMRIMADAPSGIIVLVDPRAMRQVIVNLLDNALKYGPKGQTVSLELDRDERLARLMISDQGQGIPLESRALIWQPFVRLGQNAGGAGGSGIGLSVVRGLVEQHNGDISVHDAPGGGTTFIVELEVSDSAAGLPYRATGELRVPVGRRAVREAGVEPADTDSA